jgi:hypothetical protein
VKIQLIVPNCNRNTSPIVAYGSWIAKIAGGFTATQGTGGWIDDTGSLVVEPVTIFDCYCAPKRDSRYAADFYDLAKSIAADLHQDCVYLEIDGRVDLVRQ